MITMMVARGFSNSIIPSTLIMALTGGRAVHAHLLTLFISEWAHGILFCSVGYNPLVSSFLLMLRYPQSWPGAALSELLWPFDIFP